MKREIFKQQWDEAPIGTAWLLQKHGASCSSDITYIAVKTDEDDIHIASTDACMNGHESDIARRAYSRIFKDTAKRITTWWMLAREVREIYGKAFLQIAKGTWFFIRKKIDDVSDINLLKSEYVQDSFADIVFDTSNYDNDGVFVGETQHKGLRVTVNFWSSHTRRDNALYCEVVDKINATGIFQCYRHGDRISITSKALSVEDAGNDEFWRPLQCVLSLGGFNSYNACPETCISIVIQDISNTIVFDKNLLDAVRTIGYCKGLYSHSIPMRFVPPTLNADVLGAVETIGVDLLRDTKKLYSRCLVKPSPSQKHLADRMLNLSGNNGMYFRYTRASYNPARIASTVRSAVDALRNGIVASKERSVKTLLEVCTSPDTGSIFPF
jgi:hypothetical protein